MEDLILIYLDNSATTKVCKEAQEKALYYMNDAFFNPAALYKGAVDVEQDIEKARLDIAASMGAKQNELFFTSGGTESNNIAIFGMLDSLRKGSWRFITTKIEHPSVYNLFVTLENLGHEVIYLDCDERGQIDYQQLEYYVDQNTVLVSIMHVNNEFGAVADLKRINEIVKANNPYAVFHSDGVQAYAKLEFEKLPVDMYSISGHKFYAPKGVGALMMKRQVLNSGGQKGGGQEQGIRSGTLNTPGIIAMHEAMNTIKANQKSNIENMRACKLTLAENLLNISGTKINGPSPQNGAPHILSVSFEGIRSEVLLHILEEKGIYVGIGSACSSKKQGKNRVLDAIGLNSDEMISTLRFSLCPQNTLEEMEIVSQAIKENITELRKFSRR